MPPPGAGPCSSSCRSWALRALLLALGSQQAAARNRLWPAEPSLDAETVRELTAAQCAKSPRQAAVLNARDDYPSVKWGGPPGGDGSPLHWIVSTRGLDKLKSVVDECAADATYGDGQACNDAWYWYITDLTWPFGLPFLFGIMSSLLHCTCCFVACCRICRRKFICCRERQEPREAPKWAIIVALVVWAGASIGIFALGATMNEVSVSLNDSAEWHLCTALNLASEAAGGNEGMFLGTELATYNLNQISSDLDIDGAVMTTVRRVIEDTATFHQLFVNFNRRLDHLLDVLTDNGPGFRAFEHRCVFCSIAVGDANNPTPGFPDEGLLPSLKQSVANSASQAMDNIRGLTLERFTGENLTALARGVKRANLAMDKFDDAIHASLVRYWPRFVHSVNVIEPIRLVVFIMLGWCAMAGSVIGWLAWGVTRWRFKNRPAHPPSPKPHCCSWCCGFCYSASALTLGGLLLGGAVFAGEGCAFLREELFLPGGPARYAAAFGLMAGEDDLTVDLIETCFVHNATGHMLQTLELEEPLAFEPDLQEAFKNLDTFGDVPEGPGTRELLHLLRELAEEHGNLFVLDPLAGNNSLGPLELNPNVQALMLGSTLFPDDTKGPDTYTTLTGLNEFAARIAGEGKYTFASGTAGGGFVITPYRPTDEDLESLPLAVRNALLYARAKERLLASNNSLRCDVLSDDFELLPQRCGVREFHDYVIAEVAQLSQSVSLLAEDAARVLPRFRTDMKLDLTPTLRQMEAVRTQLRCRFLWKRVEEFDDGLCNGLAPMAARGAMQMLGLAAFTYVGIVVQYKVWRHMKDNKILKYELERFEKKYHQAEARLAKQKADRERDLEAMRQYREELERDNFAGRTRRSRGRQRDEGAAKGAVDEDGFHE